MANYRNGRLRDFGNHRGPSVPPQKVYEPARRLQKPAGYAEIEAASQCAEGSVEFASFVRDVLNMQPEMEPAVREAIGQQKWKIAPNPLAAIRTSAWQAARRMGLPQPTPPSPKS